MINKIHLSNFQCHADLSLEFSPGVNVIAGQSDKGKSSIIRAICWAIENRPSGGAFCKRGVKDATGVELWFCGGEVVKRERGTLNRYVIDTPTSGTVALQALRTDVPTEVSAITNMATCSIQKQHDPYYLLQDSPGEAAKKLNAISDLVAVGEAIAAANFHVSRRKKEEGEYVVHEELVKNDLATTAPLVEVVPLVEEVGNIITAVEKEQNDVATLQTALAQLQTQKKQLEAYTGLTRATTHLQAAIAATENVATHQADVQRLQQSISIITTAAPRIAVCSKIAAIAPHIAIARQVYDGCMALEAHVNRAQLLQMRKEKAETAYDIAIHALQGFRARHPLCPICGKPWDGDICQK